MDPIPYVAGRSDLCYWCLKLTQPKLRRCSACHIAYYCSPECQRAHWKEHRHECRDLAQETGLIPRSIAPPAVRQFVKWLEVWRRSLLQWATFSADLAHQPPDYLEKHWCVRVQYMMCF